MAEISKRIADGMKQMGDIQRGLAKGTLVLREVQKLDEKGNNAGRPSLGLVGVKSGKIFAILVTKPTRTVKTTTTEQRYDSWSRSYVSRNVESTKEIARYVVIDPA